MSQLADETLFLSYPKEELESKFLVDPSPCERAAFCLRKLQQTFCLKQQMSVLCCLVYSALHVSSCLRCLLFCAMHFPSDSILFKC